MEQREVADLDAASAARQIELEERRVLEARAAVNKRMGVGNAKSGPREAKALLPVPAALRAKIGATAAMNFEFQGAAVQAQRNALEHGLMCPSCGTLHDFKSKRCRLCTANVDWDKVRQSKELAMGKDKLGKEAKERLDGQNKVWAVEARPAGTCYPLLASHVELHQTALRPAGWAAPMEGKLPRTDKQAEVDATRMMMQISKVKGHDRRDRTKAVPSPFGGVTRGGGKGGEGGKGGMNTEDLMASAASLLYKCTCKCTKVKSLVGDASIATVRKQDRYLFDFSFTLEFIISVEDSSGGGGSYGGMGAMGGGAAGGEDASAVTTNHTGSMEFSDVSSTASSETYEVVVKHNKSVPSRLKGAIDAVVEKFKRSAFGKVQDLIGEFKLESKSA